MKYIFRLLLASLLAVPGWPQLPDGVAPPPPPPPPAAAGQNRPLRRGTAAFSSTTNLVVVNVNVTDRNGNPITNLTKNDFTLLEDGKPQTIQTVDFQKLATTVLPAITPQFATRNPNPAPNEPEPSTTAELLSKYQDRRLMILLFDFSSMQPAEQIRTRDAALKFLSTQMTASDMVSIMVFGSQLRTVQEFTADRDLLTSVIKNFHIGDSSELASMGDTGADSEDQSGLFTADETEFNIFNTDRKLAALQEAAQTLGRYPEKKALVYFSSGVEKTGVDNQSQLEATVNAAVRANVAFYPIDARGLSASAPGGDATQAGAVGSNLYSGAGQRSLSDSFQNQQETLFTLASDTGGKALLDSNDLTQGITQVQKDVNSYYIIGYQSSNTAEDGRYRHIQIKLSPQLAATKPHLQYRQGYFAPSTFARMKDTDRETQLQQALDSSNPVTDLPLAVEVDYFRLEKNKYFIPVSVRIPGSALSFREKGSKRTTGLDFIGQIRDSRGRPASSVRDTIPLKLDESVAGEVVRRQIQYDTGFTLPPGKFKLRFVARENGEGKTGTFETEFTVPDLDSDKSLRLSSLVLSNQIQTAKEQQLAGAKNDKKVVAQDPLISDTGQKTVPNVTRVFHPGQNLYAFLEVYDPTVPENLPANFKIASVASSMAFYRSNQKVFETPPLQSRRLNPKRPGVLSLRLQTSLASLAPGRYTCQINVIDELGHKFGFPRASIVIVPDPKAIAKTTASLQ